MQDQIIVKSSPSDKVFDVLEQVRLIMAKKDNKISMPQTGAGLVRYFDEESLGPKLSPEHVLVATVILAIFCFVLRYSA